MTVEIVVSGATFLGVIAIAWKGGSILTSVQKDIDGIKGDIKNIKENHLSHIERNLEQLNGRVSRIEGIMENDK